MLSVDLRPPISQNKPTKLTTRLGSSQKKLTIRRFRQSGVSKEGLQGARSSRGDLYLDSGQILWPSYQQEYSKTVEMQIERAKDFRVRYMMQMQRSCRRRFHTTSL